MEQKCRNYCGIKCGLCQTQRTMTSSQQTPGQPRSVARGGKSSIPDLLSDLGSPGKLSRQSSAKLTASKQSSKPAMDSGRTAAVDKPSSAKKKSVSDKQNNSRGDVFTVKDILSRTEETDPCKVYEITIRAEKLVVIPDLNAFKKVRIIDFSSNQIETLTGMQDVKDLRELKIYDNKITHLYGIEELKELNILQAQHNKISNLAKGLHLLKKLKILRLDNNRISRIELRDVTSCVSLTSMDISFNSLQSLAFVNCLPNLEELFATNNQITEMPDISRCKKLTELKLSYNKISSIVGVFGHPSLLMLDLEGNQLQTIKLAGKVSKLENLNLSHNHLHDITKLHISFPVMDVLDVSNNFITNAELFLSDLSNFEELRELYLLGNRFPCPDPDQRPFTHTEILKVLPNLEVLDGMTLRKPSVQSALAPAPCMRPMTASSAISTRFVQHQMDSFTNVVEPFETKGTACYEQLRITLDQLPKEPPQWPPNSERGAIGGTPIPTISGEGTPKTSSRLSSRARGHSRLEDALIYASTQRDNNKQ